MVEKRKHFLSEEISDLENEVLIELSRIKNNAPEFEYAQSVISLFEEGYLRFCRWDQWRTLFGSQSTPPRFGSQDDFCFSYLGPFHTNPAYQDPEKESSKTLAREGAYFTAVINYILGYLREKKGVTIKQVRINKAPLIDAINIPEGTVICDLSQTNITSKFQGPRTVRHLDVSWCKKVDSKLDLTMYPNLEIFEGNETEIDDGFIGSKTLKSLSLRGCPAGDAIQLHEGLEAFVAPYKTTHLRTLPTTLLDYGLCSREVKGPLQNLPRLRTFWFNGEGLDPTTRFQIGLRELHLYACSADITNLDVPETVEDFNFSPSSVSEPVRFYEKLPEHLKKEITWAKIANCSTREEANRWSFLKPTSKQTNNIICLRSIDLKDETENDFFPEYQRSIRDKVEMNSASTQRRNASETIVSKLIANGIREEHAIAAVDAFEVREGYTIDEMSKNIVYLITDTRGNIHIIKFSNQKAEAEIEAAVNYHFGKDPQLARYVARSDLATPIECLVEESPVYVTLQERRTGTPFANLLQEGKIQTEKYLTEWMRILARLHVYGTEIMNNVGQYTAALRLSKAKDEERIALANHIAPLMADAGLRRALTSVGIEEGGDFIHQDIRIENRIGVCAIDWGHAGRGNYLLDIARILSDAAVQRYERIDEDAERKYIGAYLKERRRCEGKNSSPHRMEIEAVHREYQAIQLLYYQAQSGYQLSRNPSLLSAHEQATLELQIAAIPRLERVVAENLDKISKSTLQRAAA